LLAAAQPEEPKFGYRMVDFDDPNIPRSAYVSLLGVKYEDFEDLCRYILPSMRNSSNRSVRNGLAIFLSFLRMVIFQDKLGTLYGMSDQRI
jgi:hypothetical protein